MSLLRERRGGMFGAPSEVQRIALADGLTTLVAAVGMGDVAPQLFFEEILGLS